MPGIGKRAAERLTVELRDKVGVVPEVPHPLSGGATVGGEVTEVPRRPRVPAAAAEKAVAAVLAENPDADAVERLRAGLSLLGKK